jgi:hypothetical protein
VASHRKTWFTFIDKSHIKYGDKKKCIGFNQIYLGKPGEKCAQKQSGKTKHI